jgi:hypothetical protein
MSTTVINTLDPMERTSGLSKTTILKDFSADYESISSIDEVFNEKISKLSQTTAMSWVNTIDEDEWTSLCRTLTKQSGSYIYGESNIPSLQDILENLSNQGVKLLVLEAFNQRNAQNSELLPYNVNDLFSEIGFAPIRPCKQSIAAFPVWLDANSTTTGMGSGSAKATFELLSLHEFYSDVIVSIELTPPALDAIYFDEANINNIPLVNIRANPLEFILKSLKQLPPINNASIFEETGNGYTRRVDLFGGPNGKELLKKHFGDDAVTFCFADNTQYNTKEHLTHQKLMPCLVGNQAAVPPMYSKFYTKEGNPVPFTISFPIFFSTNSDNYAFNTAGIPNGSRPRYEIEFTNLQDLFVFTPRGSSVGASPIELERTVWARGIRDKFPSVDIKIDLKGISAPSCLTQTLLSGTFSQLVDVIATLENTPLNKNTLDINSNTPVTHIVANTYPNRDNLKAKLLSNTINTHHWNSYGLPKLEKVVVGSMVKTSGFSELGSEDVVLYTKVFPQIELNTATPPALEFKGWNLSLVVHNPNAPNNNSTYALPVSIPAGTELVFKNSSGAVYKAKLAKTVPKGTVAPLAKNLSDLASLASLAVPVTNAFEAFETTVFGYDGYDLSGSVPPSYDSVQYLPTKRLRVEDEYGDLVQTVPILERLSLSFSGQSIAFQANTESIACRALNTKSHDVPSRKGLHTISLTTNRINKNRVFGHYIWSQKASQLRWTYNNNIFSGSGLTADDFYVSVFVISTNLLISESGNLGYRFLK